MLFPEELSHRVLAYFGRLLQKPLGRPSDLAALDASELLLLAKLLPDSFLPALVGLLKGQGQTAFQKLLGHLFCRQIDTQIDHRTLAIPPSKLME